jgi:hypothetical protein
MKIKMFQVFNLNQFLMLKTRTSQQIEEFFCQLPRRISTKQEP